MLSLQQIAQCIKNKFSYNNVGIKKADETVCNKCLSLNWHDNIKNKTALFANQDDKYKKKDPKKTTKQLRKEKLHMK